VELLRQLPLELTICIKKIKKKSRPPTSLVCINRSGDDFKKKQRENN
jgi:hypothetical protein